MKTFIKFCRQAWDISEVYEYDFETTAAEIRLDIKEDVSKRLDKYLKKNNKK